MSKLDSLLGESVEGMGKDVDSAALSKEHKALVSAAKRHILGFQKLSGNKQGFRTALLCTELTSIATGIINFADVLLQETENGENEVLREYVKQAEDVVRVFGNGIAGIGER